MPEILSMADIRQDLQGTADNLERIALQLRGHAEYLSRSVHRQDILAVESRMRELHDSVLALRGVAKHIQPTVLPKPPAD